MADFNATVATLDPKIQALVTALVEWLLSLFTGGQPVPTPDQMKTHMKAAHPDCPDDCCGLCCKIACNALQILFEAHECCKNCKV